MSVFPVVQKLVRSNDTRTDRGGLDHRGNRYFRVTFLAPIVLFTTTKIVESEGMKTSKNSPIAGH